MNHTTLENRLQEELESLVRKNSDIFNPVLGISNQHEDFYWTGASGKAYADQPQPMKANTPFFIASITKMYTAAATMILGEQGKLSLDDPISEYLPERVVSGLHIYHNHDYSEQLTLYHLISQTSGLADYFMGKPRNGLSIFDRLINEGDFYWEFDEAIEIVKNSLSPQFPPEPSDQHKTGKTAFYSDTNYQLLGTILESVTKKSMQEIYSELIFEPLGLQGTYLQGYGNEKTTPENPPANVFYKTNPVYIDKAMASARSDGGIVSNIDDNLKFLQALLSGEIFNNPSTLKTMMNWKKIFFPLQYGFGLMRVKIPKLFSPFSTTPELIGHSGATSAFLFQSEPGKILISGTLNQVDNQARPVRLMMKLVNLVSKSLS